MWCIYALLSVNFQASNCGCVKKVTNMKYAPFQRLIANQPFKRRVPMNSCNKLNQEQGICLILKKLFLAIMCHCSALLVCNCNFKRFSLTPCPITTALASNNSNMINAGHVTHAANKQTNATIKTTMQSKLLDDETMFVGLSNLCICIHASFLQHRAEQEQSNRVRTEDSSPHLRSAPSSA